MAPIITQAQLAMGIEKSVSGPTTPTRKASTSDEEQSPLPAAISVPSTICPAVLGPQPDTKSTKIIKLPPLLSNNHNKKIYALEYPTRLDSTKKVTSILPQWIGTSTFFVSECIDLQRRGHLKSLIAYREHIIHQLAIKPYDPSLYIDLCNLDHKLGFCDIGAGNAYRALILIKAGLGIDRHTYPAELSISVRDQLSRMGKSTTRVTVELRTLHLNALREILHNLLGSAAIWDGLVQGRDALKLFPDDNDLNSTIYNLKEAFRSNCRAIQKLGREVGNSEDTREAVAYSRRGRVYQKPYPWLNQIFYTRTSALVREANKTLDGSPCEIRPVVFKGQASSRSEVEGSQPNYSASRSSRVLNENGDVGPLGIFATRNIRKGELVMVDESFGACISDLPSSLLAHCDACHATLSKPYMHPDDIIKPDCCGKVAYCSTACHEGASTGYHRVVCGKDIEWLYQDASGRYSKSAARNHSRSILFLQIMSMVLSDRQLQHTAGKKPTHPLLHPLIARMTANYSTCDDLHSLNYSSWLYYENVVAVHRILQALGVDVFTESDFAPEIIQTILWRLENNVSRCIINLSSPDNPKECSPPRFESYRDEDQDENMLCLNSQYLFFNHSCEPNVDWYSSNPDPWAGISWLTGFDGKILQPGCGAIWCIASKDVKKGEELKISYVGTPLGHDFDDRAAKRGMLNKWFDRGCGCAVCEKENETGIFDDDESEDGSGEDLET